MPCTFHHFQITFNNVENPPNKWHPVISYVRAAIKSSPSSAPLFSLAILPRNQKNKKVHPVETGFKKIIHKPQLYHIIYITD